MGFARILLFPIAFLYGLIIRLRNYGFSKGILPSKSFSTPTIVVGNLSVGGTGKTPHIEYLIRLLTPSRKVATLSRGYKRTSQGFLLANDKHTFEDLGDEPAQFNKKFGNEICVAVDAKRVNGIEQLLKQEPSPEVILLDDAFQHRHVKAGLNIVLTTYGDLYAKDYMLPAGRLREPRSGIKRADIVIVTKCPKVFNALEIRRITETLKLEHQKLYFSYIKYGHILPVFQAPGFDLNNLSSKETVVVVTGIANPDPMLRFLRKKGVSIEHVAFPDHHTFSGKDLQEVRKIFDNIAGDDKLILTTEKDAMRLLPFATDESLNQLPIYYLEMEIAFHGNGGDHFDKQIEEYVTNH